MSLVLLVGAGFKPARAQGQPCLPNRHAGGFETRPYKNDVHPDRSLLLGDKV